MKTVKQNTLQIGSFAKATGISVDTLRYYEKIGLLKPEYRLASGYRTYGEHNLQTAQFILSAKQLGFSLESIKGLLAIQLNKKNASCDDVKQFVRVQLADVESRLTELKKIRKAMERLYNNCCGGEEDARYCSILQALEKGDVK